MAIEGQRAMMANVKRNEDSTSVADTCLAGPNRPSGPVSLKCLIARREMHMIIPFRPPHSLRLEKCGPFRRRVRLGPNRVAGLLTEIEAWIAERMAARDGDIR